MDERTDLAVSVGDVTVRPVEPVANLFGSPDPTDVVEQATRVADALKAVLREQKMVVGIKGREHVTIEGWTTLGAMLGVFPVTTATEALYGESGALLGFTAHVEARTRDGGVVGGASARCMKDERNWGDRDDYALESMAQTRAASKALRMPLGFIVALAGYNATPSDEIPHEEERPKANADGEPYITEDAMADLGARAKAAGLDAAATLNLAFERYGVASLWELTVAEAGALGDILEAREAATA